MFTFDRRFRRAAGGEGVVLIALPSQSFNLEVRAQDLEEWGYGP